MSRLPQRGLVIAVDGPAASGKGTLAKRLAAHYALPHLDTGLLYRMVARAMIEAGENLRDAAAAERIVSAFDESAFSEDVLRGREIGEAASIVAAMPAVRSGLIARQRRFAGQESGAVLDERDVDLLRGAGRGARLRVRCGIAPDPGGSQGRQTEQQAPHRNLRHRIVTKLCACFRFAPSPKRRRRLSLERS